MKVVFTVHNDYVHSRIANNLEYCGMKNVRTVVASDGQELVLGEVDDIAPFMDFEGLTRVQTERDFYGQSYTPDPFLGRRAMVTV